MTSLPLLSEHEAAIELQQRRSIRRSLTEWARLNGFDPAPHQALLVDRLERVARGEIRKLAVFMPPGSAKSTYSSILFPAWYVAQPGVGNVLAASHSTELAERFGRKVRNSVSEHALILGTSIDPRSSAAGRWETNRGVEYYSAGVGVGIAGFRAKLGLIDDPVRSREEADSKTIRDKVWDWYNDDFDTRLVPGASQILVMTRWHDDDLGGRILNRDNDWDVISIPAVAGANDLLGRQPGEWLWEGDYGYAGRLREKQATADPRSWSALYQQQPTPDTGDYFRREWFVQGMKTPKLEAMRVYGASDYAVTSQGGDYTVHLVVGVDQDSGLHLLDLWRAQADSAAWVDARCDLVLKWKPIAWAEEQGQIRAGVGPWLDRRARERQAWCAREQFPTRGDKAVRAQSIRGRLSLNGINIPAGVPWAADFLAECLRFPAGVNDDQVDALGLVGQLLDQMNAAPRAEKRAPARKSWFDGGDDDDDAGQSWKVA